MMKLFGCSGAALLALSVALIGCGGSGKNNNDGGVNAPTVCVANQTSCLNASVALTCTSTGNALIPTQCGTGQKCTAGACAKDPTAPCTSDDDTCTDATHAMVCTTTGAMAVTCPANTVCAGPGLCQGSCVVGSSTCLDNNTLATCKDGSTFVGSTCGTGMGCVTTGTDPVNTAACQPAACTPDPNGCDFVCGDKTGTAGSNAAATVSTCVSTPNGFKWVAISCPSPQTCNSAGAACSSGIGVQAACASQCNPGDTMCTGDSTGVVTCGTNGTWGTTVTSCATTGTICMANLAGQGVCGDLACIDLTVAMSTNVIQEGVGVGACDTSGQFHACGSDGKVSATGTACASGGCTATQGNIGGQYQQGACLVECQPNDQQCVGGGGGSYQTCVNGLWGPAVECTGGANCLDTTPPNGSPSTACGDCAPGWTRCGGTGGTQIETCGTNGTFGTATDCAMGTCESTGGNTAACFTECFPGKTVCTGNNVTVPGVNVTATNSSAVCSATGSIPATGTACGAGTYCRTGPSTDAATGDPGNGASLGCVACVGTQNEFGLPDTRCDGNSVEQCKLDNSGWNASTEVACTGNNATCVGPSSNTPIPVVNGNYCHSDFFCAGPFGPCTSGDIVATNGNLEQSIGSTCLQQNEGAPVSCGSGANAVIDCCSDYCFADSLPTPAFCN